MSDFDSSMNDESEELIIFSHEKKELIHPFRKYQLSIIILVIITLIFIWVLFSQSKELSIHLKEHESLNEQYQNNLDKLSKLKTLYDKMELNYKAIYHLDQELNIDIIKTINESNFLQKLLSPTKKLFFKICYKATIFGDKDLEKFRKNCGSKSGLLMLIETTDGYRFGGFSSRYLYSNKNEIRLEYDSDSEAFIFSFDTKKKYNIKNPEFAFKQYIDYFPSFGRQDIFLGKNFLSESSSYSNFPYDYEKDPNNPGDYILNGGLKKFKVKEMEFLIIYEKNDYIENNDSLNLKNYFNL